MESGCDPSSNLGRGVHKTESFIAPPNLNKLRASDEEGENLGRGVFNTAKSYHKGNITPIEIERGEPEIRIRACLRGQI